MGHDPPNGTSLGRARWVVTHLGRPPNEEKERKTEREREREREKIETGIVAAVGSSDIQMGR